jgi:hypothetical protein
MLLDMPKDLAKAIDLNMAMKYFIKLRLKGDLTNV